MPTHQHDCTKCLYKETVEHDGFTVDIYHCPEAITLGTEGTLLCRYGSKGPDFWSMPVTLMRKTRGDPDHSPVSLAVLMYQMLDKHVPEEKYHA